MKRFLTHENWLFEYSETSISIKDNVLISQTTLCKKVTQWQAQLPLAPGQKWAVYHSDAFEFLAMTLALWQSRCTVCIPGDTCLDTIERLNQDVSGFLGEFPTDVAFKNTQIHPNNSQSLHPFTEDFDAIEVYTSGSTGKPKSIIKKLSQIDSELASINQLWPLPNDSIVISTATHQHLFGLTFRLFWPLVKQQIFQSTRCIYSEDIHYLASIYQDVVLIATPTHLKRLNSLLNWESLSHKFSAVISSAAPLSLKDSLFASKLLNSPVWEIYGSSETGALAWRTQSESALNLWSMLPNITLCQNPKTLNSMVKSPHISTQYQTLTDQLILHSDRTFELQGRTDRIVKVEGKRVSLSKVEQLLELNDWVDTAKALVITKKREEIAVVIEPSASGWSIIKEHSEKWLSQQLKERLKDSFELVLLPRRWRFVKALPFNTQGKIPMNSLHSLFEKEDVIWPTILEKEQIEHSLKLRCFIPKELVYFDGHFDKNPILPGITQTHWAQHFAKEAFGLTGRFTHLEAVKFHHIIFPNSEITLSLEYLSEKKKLIFQYLSDKGIHSSGKICFE